jgi:hypothetical protein
LETELSSWQTEYIRLEESQDVMGGALRPVEEPSKYVKTGGEPLVGTYIF